MNPQETIWNIRTKIPAEISEQLQDYSPIFRQILYNRNITTGQQAEAFLSARKPDHASQQLLGTEQAVERIGQALKNNEQIAIYGDYDADGVTATALTQFGWPFRVRISSPFSRSHTLRVPSQDDDTAFRPSGVIATALTNFE